MADKTLEELIAEASPEFRETYQEFSGLESLLETSTNPLVHQQAARDEAEFNRARAQFANEARAREQRKAKMAEDAEREAAARKAVDSRAAAEAEAQLMARLRGEYPAMTDTAWNSMWPQVRAQYFMEERDRRIRSERSAELYGQMTNSTF